MPSTAISIGSSVPALDRSVNVIDCLASARQALSLATITKELGIPKSSAHNIMGSLVQHGLARKDQEGNYSLGAKVIEWGSAFSKGSNIMSAFEMAMNASSNLSSETVMLAILDNTEVTYLACHPGTRPLAVNFRVGGRFTASCTSSGKAILSSWTDIEIKQLYANCTDQLHQSGKLHKLTRHSLSAVSQLCKQMAVIRQKAYAIDDEETAEGMQCFGAPVFAAASQKAVAGVAVSLIKASITPRRRKEIISAIMALARDVSERLAAQKAGENDAQR